MPGIVTLVSRHGEVAVKTVGTLAFGDTAPTRRDIIFRIASVTKPIVAAAAMILVEECRLRPDDTVDDWLPELAERRVLRAIDGPLDDTVPARRPITLRDLLTFRLGLCVIMEFPPKYPIQKAMEDAAVAPSANLPAMAPDEYMKRIGALPLVHQPGEQWLYNTGSDILGVLIARVSGRPLGQVLRERIFAPLGMKDTRFSVPEGAPDRLATCYQTDLASGEVKVFDTARGGRFAAPPAFESGAGGLVSAVDDLLMLARMMLNDGRAGRDRLLSRPTVALMTTDHVTPRQKALSPFLENFWDHRGWGFGMSAVTARDDLADDLAGTSGRYGWDGGYGTSWYVALREDLVGILMTQRVWDSPSAPKVLRDFWTSVYQALED
jgi:CubicO group peptidase (beta-lactamase class C family)